MNVLLIGAGNWAQNVIRNLEKFDDINLVYVVDSDCSKLNKVKDKLPRFTQLWTSYESCLTNPELDAVLIVTPIATHPQIVKDCLSAGQHVLCQKPVFRTLKELEDVFPILSTEKGGNLVLMGCHTFVYNPAVQEIKSRLSELGEKIRYYKSTRVNLGLFNRDNNVCDDLGIHDLTILDYLFSNDSPEYISATGTDTVKPGLIDTANISIKYKSGMLANIDLSWVSAVKNRQTIIVGSDKTVVYDDTKQDNKLCFYDSGINYDDKLLFSYRKGNMFSPRVDETEAIYNELKEFFYCIKNKKEPISGPRQIYRVTKMLEAANQSIKENGKPIYL
ncbi:MAG: Gfo/Idh/MocA family oxidoreductase [bacterium]|nr:Gfo/Idh/MocA family oxidoreductase [bacterium]